MKKQIYLIALFSVISFSSCNNFTKEQEDIIEQEVQRRVAIEVKHMREENKILLDTLKESLERVYQAKIQNFENLQTRKKEIKKEEKTVPVKNTEPVKKEVSQRHTIGSWKVRIPLINYTYNIEFYEENGKYYAYSSVYDTQSLTKKGNRYYVNGSENGDYYLINGNSLKFYDQDGHISDHICTKL